MITIKNKKRSKVRFIRWMTFFAITLFALAAKPTGAATNGDGCATPSYGFDSSDVTIKFCPIKIETLNAADLSAIETVYGSGYGPSTIGIIRSQINYLEPTAADSNKTVPRQQVSVYLPLNLQPTDIRNVYNSPGPYLWQTALIKAYARAGANTDLLTSQSAKNAAKQGISKSVSSITGELGAAYGYGSLDSPGNTAYFDLYDKNGTITSAYASTIDASSSFFSDYIKNTATLNATNGTVETTTNNIILPVVINVPTITDDSTAKNWGILEHFYRVVAASHRSQTNDSTKASASANAIETQIQIYNNSGTTGGLNMDSKLLLSTEASPIDLTANDNMGVYLKVDGTDLPDSVSVPGDITMASYSCKLYEYLLPVSKGINEIESNWLDITTTGEGENKASCITGLTSTWDATKISGATVNGESYLVRAKLFRSLGSSGWKVLGKKEATILTQSGGTVQNTGLLSINAPSVVPAGGKATITVQYSPDPAYSDFVCRIYIGLQGDSYNPSLKGEYPYSACTSGQAFFEWDTGANGSAAGNYMIEVHIVQNPGTSTETFLAKASSMISLTGAGGVVPGQGDAPIADILKPEQLEGGSSVSIFGSIFTDRSTLFGKIMIFFQSLLGALAFAGIVYGGFQYMTAAGNTSQVEKARKTLLYSVIGMVVAALSIVVVNIIINMLKS